MNEAMELRVEQTGVRRTSWRTACFLLSTGLLVIAFHSPIVTLVSLGLGTSHDADQYSHIVAIPLATLYLIVRKRKAIFSDTKWALVPGIGLLVIGVSFFLVAEVVQGQLSQHDYFCGLIASLVILTIGTFVLSFGTSAFRLAQFPLLLLVLMIPIPSWLLNWTVDLLQKRSAGATEFLFNLAGVPFVREGLGFYLPHNTNILIADVCSGIRSSIALLIASLVTSDVFLRSGWRKLALNVAVLPVSILKNGFRIVTLSLLSVYVDKRFLTGKLHENGGILFYLLGCGVLGLLLWRLRRSELDSQTEEQQRDPANRSGSPQQTQAPIHQQTS
jgi:exosortase